jgi:phage major head subunit gpT-like protein
MKLTSAALDALRVGFKAIFADAFGSEPSKDDYKKIAEIVTSTAGEEKYGWLGELPGMREWIGARVVHGLAEHDYAIKNRDFELTVGVDRNHILDDTLGTYNTRFKVLGRAAARNPNQLVFGALKDGFTTECYDGQPFFDTDHPLIQEDGTIVSVANTDGGSGTPWFLLATREIIMPLLFQNRQEPEFVNKDKVTDDNVFDKKTFLYGVDARRNVGYGFWQMAWGSKQTLNAENYQIARAAIGGMKGDHGQPLGINPNLLVVPRSLEGAALEILNAERNAAGATNVWKGTAELFVCDWI